jgi:hypothetical protein
MGSPPRLKAKTEYCYRKDSTNEYVNCGNCKFLVKVWFNRGGATIGEGRCKILGMKTSVRYRVRPDYTCNAQQPKD